MTKNTLLDRPEFAVLRHDLTTEELRRINAETAKKRDTLHCPLAQATGRAVPAAWVFSEDKGHEYGSEDYVVTRGRALRFIRRWDKHHIKRADLAAAVSAALAEREAADARECGGAE